MKNVSCISRAGWPSGKLSAVKLYQSVSMSGPSAIEKPMSEKIAVISSITWLTGWMRPSAVGAGRTRQGDVDALGGEAGIERGLGEVAALASISAVTSVLSPLMAAPADFRSSAAMLPSVASSAETEPFLPSAATRTASMAASSAAAVMAAPISVRRVAIWASRDMDQVRSWRGWANRLATAARNRVRAGQTKKPRAIPDQSGGARLSLGPQKRLADA